LADSPSTDKTTAPVRLKVAYKTAEGLISEFTRSVGKGGVAIESRKNLPIGTQFVFELHAQGMKIPPVEVFGEVVQVTQSSRGRYLLNIRYEQGTDRQGLDALLARIFESHKYDKVRKHARIPIQLRATEEAPYSPSFMIRDISLGGLGVEVEAPQLPKTLRMATPFLLEMSISLGLLVLHGEVVWIFTPPAERAKWLYPSFGVRFGKLRPDSQERLEKILSLRGLPPPPWKARVSFGMDAVSRMP
jgi:hypothetical protein